MLLVEEVAERRLRQQLHRRRALWQHVGLVLVHLHGRFAEQRVGPQRALGDARVVDARVHVDGGVGGVNVPSVANAVTLGKKPPVATSEWRGDRFASTRVNELNHFVVRSSSSGRLGTSLARVAELRRLLEEQPVLDDRAAGFEPRRERADALDVERLTAAADAERRIEVVEARLPRVARAPRLDDDESGREAAVLDRVRIRQHRHRIDRVVGQRAPA